MEIKTITVTCTSTLGFEYSSVKAERSYVVSFDPREETESAVSAAAFELARSGVEADMGVMRRSNPVHAAIIDGASRKLQRIARQNGGGTPRERPPRDQGDNRPPPPLPPPAAETARKPRAARARQPQVDPPSDFDGMEVPPTSDGARSKSGEPPLPDPDFLRE